MVLPESTSDVVKIAHVVTKHDCPFGMRGGAHSAFKGSNGIKDGVTIDFGKLTSLNEWLWTDRSLRQAT